ncbi:MAG: T9SS type A sorting domain-containing protein [Saprospiraceae bacterium]
MKSKNSWPILLVFCTLPIPSHAQSPCAAQAIDILFVVDATSSMREELAALPQNLQYFKTLWTGADIRTGGLAFRDRMERFLYHDFPFNPVADSTWQFLNSIRTVGGGDEAEPLNPMLIHSAQFEWRENARKIVFFLSDAPPRDPEMTEEAIKAVQNLNIRVFTLSPASSGKEALNWQQEVAEATGGLHLAWEDPYWHEAALALICPPSPEKNSEELPAATMKIYPNPARETTTIEASGAIRIWNNLGRLVYEGGIREEAGLTINLGNWAPGLYWVQGEETEVVKLVVVE